VAKEIMENRPGSKSHIISTKLRKGKPKAKVKGIGRPQFGAHIRE